METKTNILVVGGGPAGVVSAMTASKYYPSKKIILIRNIEYGVVPCGIPYMFASLKDPKENASGVASLVKKGIEAVVDRVDFINRGEKYVETEKGDRYFYEKLVLSIGSDPALLPIEGIERRGVYPIYKEMNYLRDVVEHVKQCKNVLVIGGGFIGVEFADELAKLDGLKVSLVEMMPGLLVNSFDREFSQLAELKLEEQGVNVLTNTRVEKIFGKDCVEKVRFSNGQDLPVDAVILGIGSRPSVKLAQDSGLDVGDGNGILVDEYMRTITDPDIFAVGDCACKRDFYTRKTIPVMLASTATAEARIAGANLYQIKVVRENKGTIAIYSTYLDGLVLGSAGLTEQTAQREGFEIVVGESKGMDKHPFSLPGATEGRIKLIFSRQSGIILGGQISCGMSCAQLINVIGIAIQKRMSITELETLQVATHPYLTSAPTMYPLMQAAQDAYSKMQF